MRDKFFYPNAGTPPLLPLNRQAPKSLIILDGHEPNADEVNIVKTYHDFMMALIYDAESDCFCVTPAESNWVNQHKYTVTPSSGMAFTDWIDALPELYDGQYYEYLANNNVLVFQDIHKVCSSTPDGNLQLAWRDFDLVCAVDVNFDKLEFFKFGGRTLLIVVDPKDTSTPIFFNVR